MPFADYQGSFGRSIMSPRRDNVNSVEATTGNEDELEAFQRLVANRFSDLSAAGADELLSLAWFKNFIDSFLCCHHEFLSIVLNRRSQLVKSPMDRLISDYVDRSLKALDICTAIRHGIDQIKQWQMLIEIVISALDSPCVAGRRIPLFESHFRRAQKALTELSIGMLDEKDSSGVAQAHRNRSFARNNKDGHNHRQVNFRSLSWSVSRSWSAARQLQAIGNNLAAPRASDILATNGLAVSVYTMTSILLLLMWALVAAIPCQDRGLNINLNVPKQFQWALPVISLHERILEESKKRDIKNACGLLREIHQTERSLRLISELADSVQFPLTEEKETEVKHRVQELVHVHGSLKEGLGPFQRQVREIFHQIVHSRTEGLDAFGQGSE